MLKTSSDYHAAINLLTTEPVISVNDITENMSSIEVNSVFGVIEMQLIDLYQKTRVLEDVQAYCREYMIKEIQEKKQKFEAKLKVIEHNADSYQETKFVACEVPFVDSNELISDRNGTTVPLSNVINGNLYASSQTIDSPMFKNVFKKQGALCYRDNLSDLVINKPYRTFYILDTPVANGVEEEITILFSDTKQCNYLKIDSSNCEIVSVNYINESDAEEPFGDMGNVYSAMRTAKGIKIVIRSINYKNENLPVDMTLIKRDSWKELSSDQISMTSSANSLYDAAQSANALRYTQDQAGFKYNINSWQKQKESIDRRNVVALQKYGGDQ